MINEEKCRDNRSSVSNGGNKPKSRGYQGKHPDGRATRNSHNNSGYNSNNRNSGNRNDSVPQKTDEVAYKSIKKKMLSMIDNDVTDDDIKLYALSSIFVGTQIEELTKTLKVLTKKMEEVE